MKLGRNTYNLQIFKGGLQKQSTEYVIQNAEGQGNEAVIYGTDTIQEMFIRIQ